MQDDYSRLIKDKGDMYAFLVEHREHIFGNLDNDSADFEQQLQILKQMYMDGSIDEYLDHDINSQVKTAFEIMFGSREQQPLQTSSYDDANYVSFENDGFDYEEDASTYHKNRFSERWASFKIKSQSRLTRFKSGLIDYLSREGAIKKQTAGETSFWTVTEKGTFYTALAISSIAALNYLIKLCLLPNFSGSFFSAFIGPMVYYAGLLAILMVAFYALKLAYDAVRVQYETHKDSDMSIRHHALTFVKNAQEGLEDIKNNGMMNYLLPSAATEKNGAFRYLLAVSTVVLGSSIVLLKMAHDIMHLANFGHILLNAFALSSIIVASAFLVGFVCEKAYDYFNKQAEINYSHGNADYETSLNYQEVRAKQQYYGSYETSYSVDKTQHEDDDYGREDSPSVV